MYGDDVALAVVEIDQTDKYFTKNQHLLNKINIPPPIFFAQRDKSHVKVSQFRTLGYPLEVYDSKKLAMERN